MEDRQRANKQLAKKSNGGKHDKQKKVEEGNQPLVAAWKAQSDKSLDQAYKLALVKLVCGAGLPPYMTDGKFWKDFVTTISSGRITPVSGTTLSERLIREEAAHVREETLVALRGSGVRWITIGFDGGASRNCDSFCTIHATTEGRRAYFLDALDTSRDQHSAEYYAKEILEVRTLVCLLLLKANMFASNPVDSAYRSRKADRPLFR